MTNGRGCGVLGRALLSGWLARPLCRRYILATFDAAVVRWGDVDGLRERPVHWAFGWLADGECEPLGVWIESETGAQSAARILADLTERGVERIWHVTGSEVGAVHHRVAAAFCGTPVSSSVDRRLTAASAVAGRRAPPFPEFAANHARERLIRAIRRHGCFESEAAVLDFVAGALQRTERRLYRGGVIAKVSPRHQAGEHRIPLGI